MSTSAVGTVLDTLAAALDAVTPGLDGVNIFSGGVSFEEAGQEAVVFGDVTFDEVPASMGGTREENFTLEGEILALKPWQGTTETTIKAARDRAMAIYAQVETYLNDNSTIGDTCLDCNITSGEITQGYNTDGRVCVVSFNVRVQAFKNP